MQLYFKFAHHNKENIYHIVPGLVVNFKYEEQLVLLAYVASEPYQNQLTGTVPSFAARKQTLYLIYL